MKPALALVAMIALAGCQAEESAANRSVASNTVAEVVAAPANTAEPAKPAIPERFRGVWAETQAACSPLTHPSRLVIGDNDLRFPDFVIVIQEVSEGSDNFAVKGYNKKTDAPMEAQYFLDVTGNILTDGGGGGAVRVRCG